MHRMPTSFETLSIYTRGLYWELLRCADDSGIIGIPAGKTAAEVIRFVAGSDRRARASIESDLVALEMAGAIQVDETRIHVRAPDRHATFDRPPTDARLTADHTGTRQALGSNIAESFNTDISHIEEKREDKKREEICEIASGEVRQVFDHWRQVMNHPHAKLDGNRRRAIDKGLKAYGLDGCLKAIDGCRASKFHMGENDRHRIYDSLELIFRNAEKTERFIAETQTPTAGGPVVNLDEHRQRVLARVKATNAKLRNDDASL